MRVAGIHNEIEFSDAMDVVSFLVQMGKIPAPGDWVDGMIEKRKVQAIEGIF